MVHLRPRWCYLGLLSVTSAPCTRGSRLISRNTRNVWGPAYARRYRRYNVYIGMVNTLAATHLPSRSLVPISRIGSVLVRPSFHRLLGSRSYSHSPPCRSYLSPGRCSSRFATLRHVSLSFVLLFLSPRSTKMRSCPPTTTPSRCTESRACVDLVSRRPGVCPSFLFHQRDETSKTQRGERQERRRGKNKNKGKEEEGETYGARHGYRPEKPRGVSLTTSMMVVVFRFSREAIRRVRSQHFSKVNLVSCTRVVLFY